MATEDECSSNGSKNKLKRCMDWLQKQNSQVKKSLQNKNDIQFIIQINADRKKFLLNAAEDEATVPPGVGESEAEPKPVPVRKLKAECLRLECCWPSCEMVMSNYEEFQKHVRDHSKHVQAIEKDSKVEYTCLWDICGFSCLDFQEMVRHLNYHAYHARLLAIGFNGRATLNLMRCNKDSTNRNKLPELKADHSCLWTGCDQKFNAIQLFFEHVKQHVIYSDNNLCSWAGCGAVFSRLTELTPHVRSHTGERQIACYHCGQHYASNRKLVDHLRRQNVAPTSPHVCLMCGARCGSAYLLGEHSRQHVSQHACALCGWSAPSAAALAYHVRYRHMQGKLARPHACKTCDYRAVTKSDLRKHTLTHTRKRKKVNCDSDDSDLEVKKVRKQYACHICPEKEKKIFTRGTILTTHLVKRHGAQWPYGYSRFRYQISEDGIYRLTTTRYETIEVSKKILKLNSDQSAPLTDSFEFTVKQTAEPTESTPRSYEIVLKNDDIKLENIKKDENEVEITMCDVDDKGNIIRTEIIKEVVLT